MSGRLSDSEKEYFIEQAETSLTETCTIRHATGVKDQYKELKFTYTDEEDVPCGIAFKQLTYKAEVGQAVVLEADAILRLSLAQDISTDDLCIVRNKNYTVDGVYEGQTLKLISLKSMETSEDV